LRVFMAISSIGFAAFRRHRRTACRRWQIHYGAPPAAGKPMTNDLDLDSYTRRIGYAGPRTASLEVLRELHWRHPSQIPFENLDVVLKNPIRLDLTSLQDKLIARRRGGYCYEQNTLLMAALRQIGFDVRSLAGRVQWQAAGRIAARHHMVLLVSLPEGEFIADVGFGGLTLTAPLKFEPGREQETPHGRYRIVGIREEFQVQARVDDEWHPLFQLSLAEQSDADWESANWYISTSPDSIFTRTVMAAIPLADRRYTLRNNKISMHPLGGRSEHRTIAEPAELIRELRETFRINLPEDADVSAIASVAGV
jgi:N-hydroxyarylamine O-acetyltransferase